MSTVKRYSGKVKWFNVTKGFGFIVPSEPVAEVPLNADVFVHASGMSAVPEAKRSVPDTRVTFVMGAHNGRPTAKDVQLA